MSADDPLETLWRQMYLNPLTDDAKEITFKAKRRKRKASEMSPETQQTDMFLPPPPKRERKHRFRVDAEVMKRDPSPTTIGFCASEVDLDPSTATARRAIVNRIAAVVPCEGQITIANFAVPILFLGPMYRNGVLGWAVFDRISEKLRYLSHFNEDGLHMFQCMRGDINLSEKQQSHLWTRLGAPSVSGLAASFEDLERGNLTLLKIIPNSINMFRPTDVTMVEVREFLIGAGDGGAFMRNFARTSKPEGFPDFLPDDLAKMTRGWKIMRLTERGGCQPGAKKPCLCPSIRKMLLMQGIRSKRPEEAFAMMIRALPSGLDRPEHAAFQDHYRGFVQFLKENPNYRFFPRGDVEIMH